MPNFLCKNHINVWVPGFLNFKGGIQVFSGNMIKILENLSPELFSLSVFSMHDTHVNKRLYAKQSSEETSLEQITYYFSGSIPSNIRSWFYGFQILLFSFIQKPNLIISTHLHFSPIAYYLKIYFGISYWVVAHGLEAWDIHRSSVVNALKNADCILAVSSYTRDRLLVEQQIPHEKICIFPNTFDSTQFAIAPKPSYLLDRYRLQSNQLTLLTVARLADSKRFKGYDQVLKALPSIRQILPTIHYLIIGKGPDRPRIKQLIDQLDLQDCVTLAGFVPDNELGDHYNLCDVFAMPSKREGFGIVYLEALACGKPALGGNQDGAVDALCGGKLGALVDPDDLEAIAQTLIQMLQGTYPNPLMYQPKALRQAVIDTYGMAAFQRRLADLLQEQGILP